MRATRTHTRFFDEDELSELSALIEALAEDWQSRSSYTSAELREAGDRRVELLRHAVALAGEVAD